MKTALASFVAMAAGMLVFIAVLIAHQLATMGWTSDIGVTAFWVGLFAFFAWIAVVFPCMQKFGTRTIFSDIRLSWFGWSVLGMACYGCLMIPFAIETGPEIYLGIWVPAFMGCVAGPVFALLMRTSDRAA